MNLSLVPPARTRQRRALTIEETDVKSPPCQKQRETCAHDSRAKNGNAAALTHGPQLKSAAASERKILMTTNTGMLSLDLKHVITGIIRSIAEDDHRRVLAAVDLPRPNRRFNE